MPKADLPFRQLAAIDLGSNSFHLVVARLDRGELRVQDRRSEKIQLGAGLDAKNNLTEDVQKRALTCLKRYAERIAGMPPGSVRVVGTNALRMARNSDQFLARARRVLGHPIDIVAGREEARLIYLGVAHTQADDRGKRLVVDIGGGSTEFIIGQRFEPLVTESLHMGCVGYALRFFPHETISEKQFDAAVTAAHQELLPVRTLLMREGWKSAVGSSGTVKAIQQCVVASGMAEDSITLDALYRLRRRVLRARHASELKIDGLDSARQGIFAPGLAILTAIFEALDVERMQHSLGALREGALYDLIGRISHEDVRDRSVLALMRRNHVDEAHAAQVAKSALKLFSQVARKWALDEQDRDLLRWAALLHEVGLDISHSNFQKHGAYLVQHADLAGFSRQEQKIMAVLVRNHRRKPDADRYVELPQELHRKLLRLTILLRLAVVLHHDRNNRKAPDVSLRERNDMLELLIPASWARSRALTLVDLEQEAGYLLAAGERLVVRSKAR